MSHNYHYYLTQVVQPILGNGVTEDWQLEAMGRMLFGRRFQKVVMSDQFHGVTKNNPYAIINMSPQRLHDGGTHWIAAAWHSQGQTLIYDSFGSMHSLPEDIAKKFGSVQILTSHAQQHVDEENCGQRCLAWLILYDVFPKQAIKM
jgi:hypothetical protein